MHLDLPRLSPIFVLLGFTFWIFALSFQVLSQYMHKYIQFVSLNNFNAAWLLVVVVADVVVPAFPVSTFP
jgi:hypothetical protein